MKAFVKNPVPAGSNARTAGKWKALSFLAGFFNLPPSCDIKPETFEPEEENDNHFAALQQEYDDLFKGTAADIFIPLWASVCLDGAGCLLDGTTLNVVQAYHRSGYEPVDMDGNPPDYIGQQFRFLCFLIACSSHEKGRICLEGSQKDAFENFVSEFTLDTVRAVADGIRANTRTPLFLQIADLMEDLLGENADEASEPCPGDDRAAAMQGMSDVQELPGMPEMPGMPAPWKSAEAKEMPELACWDIFLHGPGEPIPDEEPRVIKTAGRNNCGGKCAVTATVCDGCVLEVSTGCGFGGDPEVHACLRGRSYRQTFMNPGRLRYPMVRRAERGAGLFRRVSWKEAADLTEEKLRKLTEEYGPGCRYVNYASGIVSVMNPCNMAQRLMNLTGGSLTFYGSYSSINTAEACSYTYGTPATGNSPEDLFNTKLLILWAHNPVSTIFGSQLRQVLVKLKEKGTRIVVIDPRRSDSVISLADEWIPIIPSTDGAMADAMAYTIWSEGLQDQHFMDTYCQGFDAAHMPADVPAELNYHDYLFGLADGVVKTPEWAQAITGVPAETIRRLAVEYASAKPACLLPGLGNQRTGNGEQTSRALMALTCLTGNVGIPGGGAAGNGMAVEEAKPSFPAGPNPYKGVISCFLWPKAILEGHRMTREKDHIKGMEQLESDLKLMFNLAGDTLLNQHSDINGTIPILKDTSKCEWIVSSDVFMTPSMRYSDLLLPGPSFLEENDINIPWRYGHYLLATNKAVEPVFGCVSEYSFFAELARRFGVFEEWSEGNADREEHLRSIYERLAAKNEELPPFDVFMGGGGYNYKKGKTFVAFAEQVADPKGHPFSTPSGKIEIVSSRIYALQDPELPAHPGYVACKEGPADPLRAKYPLQLIGYHTKRRCHSTHDNNPFLAEADPQQLWIHPADAAARGIADGDTVRIFNDRGAMRIPAKVTDRVIRGVCALSQGAWYTPERQPSQGQHYPDDVRGSINVLTAFRPTPLAKGNPQHTNLVEVERAGGLS